MSKPQVLFIGQLDRSASLASRVKYAASEYFSLDVLSLAEVPSSLFFEHTYDLICLHANQLSADLEQFFDGLRKKSPHLEIPVFLISELENVHELETMVSLFVDDYISLPFSEKLIVSKILSLAKKHSLISTREAKREEMAIFHKELYFEHKSAERIYEKFVNGPSKKVVGVDVHISPASVFNGDLFLSAITPAGDVLILLGDFTGHGLPAAIGAVPVAEVFYAMVKRGRSAARMISVINEKLRSVLPSHIFFACAVVQVCPSHKRARVFNMGMQPILIADQGDIRVYESSNVPLGILDSQSFDLKSEMLVLSGSEQFVFFTDGIVEAFNADEEMFGITRVQESVSASNGQITQLLKDVETFCGSQPNNDDVTVISISVDKILQASHEFKLFARENFQVSEPSDWALNYLFEMSNLRTRSDPVEAILDMMMELQPVYSQKERIYIVLQELFNNALEHGVLGLSSDLKQQPNGFLIFQQQKEQRLETQENGFIEINIVHKRLSAVSGEYRIQVKDSGSGFDVVASQFGKAPKELQTYGRGGYLVESICSCIQFNELGNEVTVVFPWTLAD